jgi:L-cystine uptake protein TcyP (sodium:dicarboxylate symporter family)
MRPLAALLAILMGSAVALASGLILTWIVILFLPAEQARFAPENPALVRAVVIFTAFAAVTAVSFYGEQRGRRWRLAAHAATLAMFALAVWLYWPQ